MKLVAVRFYGMDEKVLIDLQKHTGKTRSELLRQGLLDLSEKYKRVAN
jgi:hypothetical protein